VSGADGVRVVIDTEACTGHGRCYMVAPSVFASDDSGFGVVVVDGPLDADQLVEARSAVGNCPERAVALTGPGSA
jgi:ferredoxin